MSRREERGEAGTHDPVGLPPFLLELPGLLVCEKGEVVSAGVGRLRT